ncbi:MAG: DMT family transporter [Anaerolineae bacterium]|nr:DMT family transporter [Anaerolineae bacterium]
MAEQAHATTATTTTPNWQPYAALVIGLFAVSTAAIFIRLAQADHAPSLVLAAARLCVASLILTPVVLRRHRHELRDLSVSDLKWALASGLVLGLHFATWITSLEFTAVVNSVTLVTTNPLWVALLAPFVLGEKLDRWVIIGLVCAMGGGILVGLSGEVGEPPNRHDPLLGNGLALVGAVMAAIYFVIGRRLRARLSLMLYIWLVYSAAALVLIPLVIAAGEPVTGFPAQTYLWMLLMGLVPQLIGHSSFNYALGFFPAAYVSLVILVEPVGSGLLAIIFLNEWPVLLQLIGATLILLGIAIASRENRLSQVSVGD